MRRQKRTEMKRIKPAGQKYRQLGFSVSWRAQYFVSFDEFHGTDRAITSDLRRDIDVLQYFGTSACEFRFEALGQASSKVRALWLRYDADVIAGDPADVDATHGQFVPAQVLIAGISQRPVTGAEQDHTTCI